MIHKLKTAFIFALTLFSGMSYSAKAQESPTVNTNVALGNWSLVLPNGAAGWMTIGQHEGALKAELWTVGMGRATDNVRYDGNTLTFYRKISVGAPEYAGGPPTGPKVNVKHIATIDGDRITVDMQWPNSAGDIEEQRFHGKRLRPLPPRPNLDQVQYGETIELFNGRDLTGWRLTNPSQMSGWKAEDGELVNTTPKLSFDPFSQYGNLRTDREFDDFNLILEFNVPKGGNSGVYLRGRYEAQVVDRDSPMQGIQGVGAIFSRMAPSTNAGKLGGQWQSYDITLVDRHVTVILNGTKVIDNQPIVGATNGALSADDEAPGPIYLQGDHTAVRYRNLYLRPVVRASGPR
ncbi:hypothetical protein Pla22_14790 [Rubripirellula amarantea]|uniref:3-keto-alpha-glucoside-1,2-lyase/3-keto-2-hydroxy-glucal hydratase domain-containing protein n=1 Tax=Rubripirellula amarantea TaxID=2527999 RepID=A0A5C5WV49_9BACT|nr:DUF1080 domain-containing protein [Rubripirellula amarantea]TWT53845.1 hypothetical protein Pla22_14790 [Rubripirellula amarantea]